MFCCKFCEIFINTCLLNTIGGAVSECNSKLCKDFQCEKDIHLYFSILLQENQSPKIIFWKDCAFTSKLKIKTENIYICHMWYFIYVTHSVVFIQKYEKQLYNGWYNVRFAWRCAFNSGDGQQMCLSFCLNHSNVSQKKHKVFPGFFSHFACCHSTKCCWV